MGIEIGALAAYAAIAGSAVSIYSAMNQKGATSPPPPPAAPPPPAMQSPQVGLGGDAFSKRAAAAGGIMSNIATSASGLTAPASTTGKTLLGQ